MTRGSVRLRLTVLFASLFLAAGAGLLAITYGLVSHATNGIIVARFNGIMVGGPLPSGQPSGTSGSDGSDGSASGGTAAGGATSGGAASGAAGSLGPGTAGGLGTQLTLPSGFPEPGTLNAATTQYASDTRSAEKDALLLYSGIALGIMLVVSAALGWFAAGRALRPLRRITAAARRISVTNLHERLALAGPDDDVRELADMIDSLFARLDASLQAQRQFVANASHELRTPLARSRTLLEVALRDPAATPGSLRTACERAIAAGAEQERLIEALLILARGQRGLASREPLDLAAITRDVLAARGAEIAAGGLDVQVELSTALLAGDAALAERAAANLIDNAFLHNVPGGAVWVSVAPDGGRAVLTVGNTGPEIGAHEVGRLLLPFQRGGPAGSSRTRSRSRAGGDDGLGLGLSIVAAIAAAHQAGLSITPRLNGGGLTARLAFPPAYAVRPASAAQSELSPGATGPLELALGATGPE